MQNNHGAVAEIGVLEAAALRAAQAGNDDEATRLWDRILAIDPNHGRSLTALGQRAFRTGDMAGARAMFQRIADADGRDPQQWIHLAAACRNQKDEAGEEHAIRRALETDPRELVALILRADLLERQGKTHQAAAACARNSALPSPRHSHRRTSTTGILAPSWTGISIRR